MQPAPRIWATFGLMFRFVDQWYSQNGFHVHAPSSVISMLKVSRQLSSTLLYGALSESGAV
jgi:hypothetical protein